MRNILSIIGLLICLATGVSSCSDDDDIKGKSHKLRVEMSCTPEHRFRVRGTGQNDTIIDAGDKYVREFILPPPGLSGNKFIAEAIDVKPYLKGNIAVWAFIYLDDRLIYVNQDFDKITVGNFF